MGSRPLRWKRTCSRYGAELDGDGRRTDEEVLREEAAMGIAFRQVDCGANSGNGRKWRDRCRQHSRRMCRDADKAVRGGRAAVAGMRVNVDDRCGCSKHGENNAQNGCPSLAVPCPRLNSASQNQPAIPASPKYAFVPRCYQTHAGYIGFGMSCDWRRNQDKKHAHVMPGQPVENPCSIGTGHWDSETGDWGPWL
jgi:hypothetical protein